MRLRIRGPSGQKAVTLPDDATVADLRKAIADSTSLVAFDIRYGYPPKALDLGKHSDSDSIAPFKLDGEQLIISEKPTSFASASAVKERSAPAKPTKSAASIAAAQPLSLARKKPSEDPPEIAVSSHAATLVLRIMPDDNSCLFRAFNSAYFGAMDNMHELRSIIAQTIQQDKDTYSAVVLDKDPDRYCQWIQNPDAWGGAIELQILSKHFDVEICSIDVQTLRIDKYNEGRPQRCILVYSGIHYDVVALTPSDPPYDRSYAPPEFDTKIFDSYDEEILGKARELGKGLQAQGYFTDTAGFRLKCNICGGAFTGEKGAIAHAEATGHSDFGEA